MSDLYNNLEKVERGLFRKPKTTNYYARLKLDRHTYRTPLKADNIAEARMERDIWAAALRTANPKRHSMAVTLRQVAYKWLRRPRKMPYKNPKRLKIKIDCLLAQCPWPGGADVLFRKVTGEWLELWILGGHLPTNWPRPDYLAPLEKGLLQHQPDKADLKVLPGLVCLGPMHPSWRGRPLKPSSFNNSLSMVKEIFAFGVRRKHRIGDPFDEAEIQFIPDPCSNTVRLNPSFEEFLAIVAYTRGNLFNRYREETANLQEFCGRFGLGEAEAVSLTWDMLDFHVEAFDLERVKTRRGFTIPVYPWAKGFINKLYAQANAPGGRGTAPGTRIFTIQTCRVALTSACRVLELPHFTPRGLRRMCIFYQKFGDMKNEEIAKLQCHHDKGRLIENVYDNATCSADGLRKFKEVKDVQEKCEKILPLMGLSKEDIPELVKPVQRNEAEGLWKSDGFKKDINQRLADALAPMKERMRKGMEKPLNARFRSVRRGSTTEVEPTQPELLRFDTQETPITYGSTAEEMTEMRELKRQKRNAVVLQPLIDAGDLENVVAARREAFNTTRKRFRLIQRFLKEAADQNQLPLLKVQLADARKAFNACRVDYKVALAAQRLEKRQRDGLS